MACTANFIHRQQTIKDLGADTVKPVLSGHSKIDKTNIFKTNGSLIKVESIAKCSKRAFCNTFDLHLAIISLKNQFLVFFFEWPLKTVLLYNCADTQTGLHLFVPMQQSQVFSQ